MSPGSAASPPAPDSRRRSSSRARTKPRHAEPVGEDVVPVALEERVEVEERGDVAGERDLEGDVADRARLERQAQVENAPASVKSDNGPATLTAKRRWRGSNQTSDVSTKA